MKRTTLFAFSRYLIGYMKELRRDRTVETYTTTLNSFTRFLEGKDIPFKSLTSSLVDQYQVWLQEKGLTRNTTSFYMRNLRAIYNQAVDRGLAPPTDPFRHVYTGVDKTRKRALPLSVIRRIKVLDLSTRTDLSFARDMFLFSFYTRGMSFIDMSYLRPSNLQEGYLVYARKKTGQPIRIKWEKSMQDIIDRYPANPAGYLLPIITSSEKGGRNQYRNILFHVNSGLADISEMLRIDPPVTTYVARHSWASIAYSRNVPIAVISEAMGHDSERTTRIYLASVSNTKVDKANSMILHLL